MESAAAPVAMSSGTSGDSSAHGLPIGGRAEEFGSLLGVDGQSYALDTFRHKKVLVLVFAGNACPAAKACWPSVVELQRRYASKGVQVVALNPNNPYLSSEDSFSRMRDVSTESGFNFPYLKDVDGAAAKKYGAQNTPHFLVLDQDRRLRYRGRMFDSRDPARATTQDLQDAVESVLSGRPVQNAETRALGCSIVW